MLLLFAAPAAADTHQMEIEEVLTSWQGDDTVQFLELEMLADGQNALSTGSELMVDDATGNPANRHFFTFPNDVATGVAGARVLISTVQAAQITGITPDFQVSDAFLPTLAGRVCYIGVDPMQGPVIVDCLAYGKYTGNNGAFGHPTPLTPDDRSLVRRARTHDNRTDWTTTLTPQPQNNAGQSTSLVSLCGNDQVDQGEQCDGSVPSGVTCTSLGFVSGKVRCIDCHLDTTKCTLCGNDQIDGKEQCDGTDFGERTCQTLGFTGGTLTCGANTDGANACKISTASCDPTFFVPGGASGPDCLAEWQVKNAAARPDITGKAPSRQRCKDGDAGCDADATAGQCTFTVAVCLDRTDARVKSCPLRSIESWTLLKPVAGGSSADDAFIDVITTAVAALGASSTSDGTVTFNPPLDPTQHCTTPFPVVVPTHGSKPGSRVVRARVTGVGGKPRDVDPLKLICAP